MTLFEIPKDITDYLAELDDFIEREIKPIEQRDDNIRFFDHRREHARTDWDNNGMPRHDWEDLLREMRQVADKAGHFPLRAARRIWRPEWQPSRDGMYPRASGGKGAGAAQ
jgi:hypothetical protein